jgi:hypothetical protein
MKVEILDNECLLFIPKNKTERYALERWYSKNCEKEVQMIYDRVNLEDEYIDGELQ